MKILVGISGGVDSAFAAKVLLEKGARVEGAVLKMHEHTEISEAAVAAENVGIPLHVIDCAEAFNNIIRKNFVEEYLAGRTPNPCIKCNELVKFRYLYDYAMANGFDAIATGHYARIVRLEREGGVRFAFCAAEDSRKDQTYMLHRLPQGIMEKLILPLGDICKDDVRRAALQHGISAADRAESQEICFLPEGNYPEYIESVAGKCPPGNFINDNGEVLGRHKGIIHYTVGQRKGLGISLGERAFVTDIDPESNTVTLSAEHKGTLEVFVEDIVYSAIPEPEENFEGVFSVKLRYASSITPCRAVLTPDGCAVLSFDTPVKAAPGQSAVLYRDGVVVCGGFIARKRSVI